METKTILLVEDNPDDELLTIDALRTSGIKTDISVVRDGAEAIDFLFARGDFSNRGSAALPRLVLLDLKLPKLGGLQVLERMRTNSRTRQTPVVVLTSSAEESDLVRAYDLGANSYLQKPVEFEQFVDLIKVMGLYWLLHNKVPRRS